MQGDYKILVIASSPSDLSKCAVTLAKLAQRHKVHVVMVKSRAKIAAGYPVNEIQDFDYGAVTQANVNALRAVVDELRPSLAIIPSIKTLDPKLGVLAKSSLLACRSVASILMIHDPRRRSQSSPSVFSMREPDSKKGKTNLRKTQSEAFESQRIILLGDIF